LCLDTFDRFVVKTIPAIPGDVVGPAGATDHALARFDGATGKVIENSTVILDDAGNLTSVTTINGGTISGNNSGDVVMAAFGSAPNANGATITSGPPNQTLTLQPADGTHPGGLTITTQSISGVKNFNNGLGIPGGSSSSASIFFFGFSGDGIYYDVGMGSLALAQTGKLRFGLRHALGTPVVPSGDTHLILVSGLSVIHVAGVVIDFLCTAIGSAASGYQSASGTAFFALTSDGVTATGTGGSSAVTRSTAGGIAAAFNVVPNGADSAYCNVVITSSVITAPTFTFSYNVRDLSDNGITLTPQ